MSERRFLVAVDGLAEKVTQYAVAQGGIVKHVTKATVAQGGVARQYYPPAFDPTTPPISPGIKWGAGLLYVRQSVISPAVSTAQIVFYRNNGYYSYTNYPNPMSGGQFLSPPLDGTAGDDGKYIIRCVQNSGDAVTGTLNTWVDLNAGNFSISLTNSASGILEGNTTISVAEDDGTGNPKAGTQVDKTVVFWAEVRGDSGNPDDIGWSTFPHNLVHITQASSAFCIMSFYPTSFLPNGEAHGRGDTSGSFQENWLKPSGDQSGMTIRADLVSGTVPQDNPGLGVELPLDGGTVYQWLLYANNPGDDYSNSINYTVTDGANSVTKLVTMHSQYAFDPSKLTWTTTPWELIDLTPNAEATLVIGTNGVAFGTTTHDIGAESEAWHSDAPNPVDAGSYVVLIELISYEGSGLTSGDSFGVPKFLTTAGNMQFSLLGAYAKWEIDVTIRYGGQAGVKKRVTVELGDELAPLPPPGGGLPPI